MAPSRSQSSQGVVGPLCRKDSDTNLMAGPCVQTDWLGALAPERLRAVAR
jgi:hypothetical protein